MESIVVSPMFVTMLAAIFLLLGGLGMVWRLFVAERRWQRVRDEYQVRKAAYLRADHELAMRSEFNDELNVVQDSLPHQHRG